MKTITPIIPKKFGWLQSKLDKEEMDFLWQCIDEKGKDLKHTLVGQISSSYEIQDKDNWFFTNVLSKLGMEYENKISNLGKRLPIIGNQLPFSLSSMWVNYQKQSEFNPTHNHLGVYSFVIWMKIPTKYEDQSELPIAKNTNGRSVISNFSFNYQNILGGMEQTVYEMCPEYEGTILFFPSELNHTVYPFYNSEEERISISGNIGVDLRDPLDSMPTYTY